MREGSREREKRCTKGSVWEAWKKNEEEKEKRKLAAFQYASEMECKNRNCKMCNCKLGWTNAGIASDVSRRLFRYYPPPPPSVPLLFFVDFFQLFETAYESRVSLPFSCSPLSMNAQEDFTSISRTKSSVSYTNDTIVASRCNYRNVISSGK